MSSVRGVTSFAREFVTCLRSPENVATVVLDRPRANALSLELVRQIAAAFDHLMTDLPSSVVIWGGPRAFSAGADISEMGGAAEARRATAAFREAFDAVEALPRIVIAAINGYALGGGFELALACDFRVAGKHARAGLPEIQLGLLPGAGGTQRLPRLVGTSRAKQFILSGRGAIGDDALALGLVDRIADDDYVLGAAHTWATEFAAGPKEAQALAKRLIAAAVELPLPEGLDLEAREVTALFGSGDAQTGIRSFLENGPGQAAFR